MSTNKIKVFSPNPAQNQTFSQQAQQQYQQAQGMNLGQLASMAHNQFGSAYNAYAQQSMHQQYATQQGTLAQIKQHASQAAAWGAAQQHQGRFNHNTWTEQRWQIDGRYMSLQEFVDFIWPEDCPDKTFFVLKFTKETNNVESRK